MIGFCIKTKMGSEEVEPFVMVVDESESSVFLSSTGVKEGKIIKREMEG